MLYRRPAPRLAARPRCGPGVLLVALYVVAVRTRWGQDLDDAASTGRIMDCPVVPWTPAGCSRRDQCHVTRVVLTGQACGRDRGLMPPDYLASLPRPARRLGRHVGDPLVVLQPADPAGRRRSPPHAELPVRARDVAMPLRLRSLVVPARARVPYVRLAHASHRHSNRHSRVASAERCDGGIPRR